MKIISAIVLFCMPLFSFAQSKVDVENAVRDYVDGFYYGDTSKIINSISPGLVKHGFYLTKNKEGYQSDTMTYRQCIDYAANVKKRGVNPNVEKFPKKIEIFDVLDKTASAKLTAWWGTDYLFLSNINGKWMVTHVLWQSVPASK